MNSAWSGTPKHVINTDYVNEKNQRERYDKLLKKLIYNILVCILALEINPFQILQRFHIGVPRL